MVKKRYKWAEGAKLEEHTKRKHKILREYFFNYLTVRCKLPQQERFRLAIVDGFAGGGRYECGTSGSPLIFIEELKRATDSINSIRATQGLKPIEIECLLIFNDADQETIDILKGHTAPLQAEIKESCPRLHIQIVYFNQFFEVAYPKIKQQINNGRYKNVIFNLDQCGHSHVERNTILDIMHSYQSAEIFYTFVITALLAFLNKQKTKKAESQLRYLGLDSTNIQNINQKLGQNEWLGNAEKLVFEVFHGCAPFVSPFSINNPDGWRYWLIHFANFYRARQVYNNVLHDNATLQAHFGRSGLNMLSYDPSHEGTLYLFDISGRAASKAQLIEDIPRLITDAGDAMPVQEFLDNIYNLTPAHSDDINSALIQNPDLEVVKETGGVRRVANAIRVDDVIRIKNQRSFFPMFFNKTDET